MDTIDLLSNLPLIIIIVFLIIVIIFLMMERGNIMEISEKQNSIKEKIEDIEFPDCPACPANPGCPICPTMTCPEVNCPKNPGCPSCPTCPDHPGCPDVTCPICNPKEKECPICESSSNTNTNSNTNKNTNTNSNTNKNTNSNSNKNCPSCPIHECPSCPECHDFNKDYKLPSAKEIADAIFPGRNTGILTSGEYFPVDDYVKRTSTTYSDMNKAMPSGSTNSNIVPVTDVFYGAYAPFNTDKLLGNDMYPVNFNPFSESYMNSNAELCLINPNSEMCTNANRPINSNVVNSNVVNSNVVNANKSNANKSNVVNANK